jgi:hypothetical protein
MEDDGPTLDYAPPPAAGGGGSAFGCFAVLATALGVTCLLFGFLGLLYASSVDVGHPRTRHEAFVHAGLFLAIGVVCVVAAVRAGREAVRRQGRG